MRSQIRDNLLRKQIKNKNVRCEKIEILKCEMQIIIFRISCVTKYIKFKKNYYRHFLVNTTNSKNFKKKVNMHHYTQCKSLRRNAYILQNLHICNKYKTIKQERQQEDIIFVDSTKNIIISA